jgi:hypothetical protein
MIARYRPPVLRLLTLRHLVRTIRTQTLHEQTLNDQSDAPSPRPPGLGLATPREVRTCLWNATHLMLLLARGVPQPIHCRTRDGEESPFRRVSITCHVFAGVEPS